MLKIKGSKIALTRGDSAYITLVPIMGDSDEQYELQEGDSVHAQIRTVPNTGDLLVEGNILLQEDGTIIWYLRPSDTRNLDIGDYYWDAQLELSNGDIFTFIPSSLFKITDEVTMYE